MTGTPGAGPGRPARVAVVITRLEGGAGLLALRGAQTLDPGSFEVTIVTGSGSLTGQARAAGLEVVTEPSLRRPIDPVHDLAALRRLTDLLRRRRFDVVHTHTSKAGAVGRVAARRAGTGRLIHTYHGFPFHEFSSPARRAAYIAIERRLGTITDLTLCVGNGVAAEAVRRRLAPPDRIRAIGVAVDTASIPVCGPVTRAAARRALGLPDDAVVVGAVGRLDYQKAPEDFVAAVRQLSPAGVTGVWVGGGERERAVRRLAAGPGAPVLLVGERADATRLLPAFDVFLLTSRYEGLPTVLVEAMACGVPVVATAVNAVGDLVAPGQTGLLAPPQRPALMAAAVRHLLAHPGEAGRMARAARARLADRYTLAALRDSLRDAYVASACRGGDAYATTVAGHSGVGHERSPRVGAAKTFRHAMGVGSNPPLGD